MFETYKAIAVIVAVAGVFIGVFVIVWRGLNCKSDDSNNTESGGGSSF